MGARGTGYPDFSGDGTKLAFASGAAGGKRSIYVSPVAGGIPEMVCEDCGLGPSFSSDGTKILYEWGIPRYIGLLEIATRQTTQLLRNPKYGLLQGRFSPDDRWICFQRTTPSSVNNRLTVAPFRGAAEIPEFQWIPVTDGTAYDMRPRWSPDGNLIYFNSNRDGFQCLWAQRLDPVTKRPAGATINVYHFHSARRSLVNPLDSSEHLRKPRPDCHELAGEHREHLDLQAAGDEIGRTCPWVNTHVCRVATHRDARLCTGQKRSANRKSGTRIYQRPP